MKKYIYPMALAATLLTTTGCSDDEVNDAPVIPDDQKELISFSVSDEANSTRAGFIGSETSLAMRIQSTERLGTDNKYTRTVAKAAVDGTNNATSYSVVTFDGLYKRYWDDAHGRKSLLSVYAVAVPNGGSSIKNNSKTLEELLTPGDASNTWGSNDNNSIAWQVTTSAQEKDAGTNTPVKNIDQEDLVYSNNIQADGKDGVYRDYGNGYTPELTGDKTHQNGQMLFFQSGMNDEDAATTANTDAPGHFDKGHLVFNHALSRITVTLVEGKGFDKTSANQAADFNFDSGTNITLLDMNVKGTLDIPTGVWTIPTKADGGIANIDKMAQTGTGTYAADYSVEAYRNSKYITLTAQMLPDYVFKDADETNVMQFTIDNNTYYITQNMLFHALAGKDENKTADYGFDTVNKNKFTMMQGKNYFFTIAVNKTEIQAVTATLADWVDVKGEYSIDNSHITVTTYKLSGSGDKYCDEFNFYRLGQKLDKIYTDASYEARIFSGDYKTTGHAKLNRTSADSHIWNTNWFYESNDTAYHFRTLNNIAAGKNSFGVVDDSNIENSTSKVSSFKMESGPQSTNDYHWGAPMKTVTADELNTFLKYDLEKGFSKSIHDGIVAPKNDKNNTINITELHMMSNINIRLVTDSIAYKENGETKYKLSPAAVNLEDAEITLTRFAKTASVDMGTGKITEKYTAPSPLTHSLDGDDDCAKITAPAFIGDCWWLNAASIKASTDWYTYAVVPQPLRRSDADTPAEADCVGITIRTSDNNEYYVITDLATITATSVTTNSSLNATRDQAENAKILRWFPGHSYNYTIKISKKGIEAITCTVADWVTVTAKQIDIDLES